MDAIIDKVTDRAHREEQDAALNRARAMRDRIEACLPLLAELDDLTSDEKDHSCFHEIATLFADIGAAAAEGTRAALSAGREAQLHK